MTREWKHPHVDTDMLESALLELERRHRVAYCAAMTNRMLPAYDAFQAATGWGDGEVLRDALAIAWAVAMGQHVLAAEVLGAAEAASEVAPVPAHFDVDSVSAALDAASAAQETLACCTDGDVRHASTIATLAFDSVDMLLQVSGVVQSGSAMEQALRAHPLILRERDQQRHLLTLLRDHVSITPEVVGELLGLPSVALRSQ